MPASPLQIRVECMPDQRTAIPRNDAWPTGPSHGFCGPSRPQGPDGRAVGVDGAAGTSDAGGLAAQGGTHLESCWESNKIICCDKKSETLFVFQLLYLHDCVILIGFTNTVMMLPWHWFLETNRLATVKWF